MTGIQDSHFIEALEWYLENDANMTIEQKREYLTNLGTYAQAIGEQVGVNESRQIVTSI